MNKIHAQNGTNPTAGTVDFSPADDVDFRPAAVEKKLASLLNKTANSALKASLLSLVVIHDNKNSGRVAALLEGLFGKRPLRIIRIENGHSILSRIDATARCFNKTMQDEVCFEEIVVTNGPDNRGQNPGFWSPFILRDVPAVIFWFDDHRDFFSVMEEAEHYVDLCMIDSREWERMGKNPIELFSLLHSYFIATGRKMHRVPLVDLSWRRLLPLRQISAFLFEPPANRPSLENIASVQLAGVTPAATLLFSGWLAARLSWIFSKSTEGFIDFTNNKNEPVRVYSKGGEMPLPSVKFRDRKGMEYSASYSGDGLATLASPGGSRTQILRLFSDPAFLLHEVDTLHADPQYYEVLEKLASEGTFAPGTYAQ